MQWKSKNHKRDAHSKERITNIKFTGFWAIENIEAKSTNSVKEAVTIAYVEYSLKEHIKT